MNPIGALILVLLLFIVILVVALFPFFDLTSPYLRNLSIIGVIAGVGFGMLIVLILRGKD